MGRDSAEASVSEISEFVRILTFGYGVRESDLPFTLRKDLDSW
jgi:hypothetical protein